MRLGLVVISLQIPNNSSQRCFSLPNKNSQYILLIDVILLSLAVFIIKGLPEWDTI